MQWRWLTQPVADALLACVQAAHLPPDSQSTRLPSHKIAAAVALESVPAAQRASKYSRPDVAKLLLGDRNKSGHVGKYTRGQQATLTWLRDAVAATDLQGQQQPSVKRKRGD